jgi:hypothetical protein
MIQYLYLLLYSVQESIITLLTNSHDCGTFDFTVALNMFE